MCSILVPLESEQYLAATGIVGLEPSFEEFEET